jgi:ATP-dependent Lon protease
LLAAHRVGITTILIPKDNAKDLVEIPDEVKQALSIRTVDTVDDVWLHALEGTPGSPRPSEVPATEVPLWGQQPTAEAPASNQ